MLVLLLSLPLRTYSLSGVVGNNEVYQLNESYKILLENVQLCQERQTRERAYRYCAVPFIRHILLNHHGFSSVPYEIAGLRNLCALFREFSHRIIGINIY